MVVHLWDFSSGFPSPMNLLVVTMVSISPGRPVHVSALSATAPACDIWPQSAGYSSENLRSVLLYLYRPSLCSCTVGGLRGWRTSWFCHSMKHSSCALTMRVPISWYGIVRSRLVLGEKITWYPSRPVRSTCCTSFVASSPTSLMALSWTDDVLHRRGMDSPATHVSASSTWEGVHPGSWVFVDDRYDRFRLSLRVRLRGEAPVGCEHGFFPYEHLQHFGVRLWPPLCAPGWGLLFRAVSGPPPATLSAG